jgi:hypothetical protein
MMENLLAIMVICWLLFDVDGNVRGISTMLDGLGDYVGMTLHAITIRGNQDGDAINFQYYDASENEVLPSGTSYAFVMNELVGNLMEPHEINVGAIKLPTNSFITKAYDVPLGNTSFSEAS